MSSTATEARVLGDFVLREKLGEGGFGTVYRAEQRTLERPAVIKVMRKSLASRKEAIDRFVLEARLASRFDHPYAAHVYAFGAEPDGLLWIAMELVRGTPLNELISQSGPLSLDRFVPFMERLSEALQSGHDQGIVHRDIKPSNVMVIARSGRLIPKLLDFGIAKLMGADEAPKVVVQARAKRPTDPAGTVPEHTPVELEHTAQVSASSSGTPSVGITVEGQILGSPAYMAPEQWMDASRVGPWTDQYALAMLAYEVLTGARAFSGTTVNELASMHMYKEIPPLPAELPAALHAVLLRASAKEPEGRYKSLNDFAAAIRTACSSTAELEERVELPTELFATWSADAPRPIADAIASIAAARSPVRVGDRVRAAASTFAHWLGIVSIGCRTRAGKLGDVELVRELRKRNLRDEEWLDVAVAMTKPFAAQPETSPLPELVTFVASDAMKTLRSVLRGEGALGVVGAATSVEHQTATARVAQLASVLQAATWLLDYEVARETAAGLELWMGAHTDELVVRAGRDLQPGRVVVLDADGARVLVLSPLVTIHAPTAGDPDRLFLLAGPGRTAELARFIALPHGFEHERDDVWRHLADTVIDGASRVEDNERSPFPGLVAFSAKDHESFIGREREVEQLLNRLRTQPMVAVVGPSGVGKSSFLAAGVISALPGGWHAELVRPGADPLAALAGALERGVDTPYRGRWRFDSSTEPKVLAGNLNALAEQREQTLVIVIDQAEELFTMCNDEARRLAFADALATAAAGPRVRVVLGMRDDFFCRVEALAPWREMLSRAVQILRVPIADELERILTVPAKRRGYEFDQADLPRKIVADVADRPGALPLLAFVAAELWDARDRHFKRLTRAAYDKLGGVSGALVQHADGVVDELPAPDRRLVRLAFRRLLTAEGTRALISRADLVTALGGNAAATKIVEHLLASRLIVSRDDEAGERVEIVHEALVTMWPRLAEWRREDDADVRIREQLAAAAKHWAARDRAAGLLWSGDALADLRRFRARSELALTSTEAAFADASEQAHRSRRRKRVAIVAGAFAVLATGVVVLGSLNRVVSAQRKDAMRQLADGFQERGRAALAADDAGRALVFFAEAKRLGVHGPAFDLLVARAAKTIEGQTSAFKGRKANRSVAFDASVVAKLEADGSLDLEDRKTGELLGASHADAAAIAGERVVAIDGGDVLAIARNGKELWRAKAAHDPATDLKIRASAAGHVAVSLSTSAKLWNLDDGALRAELPHAGAANVAAFDATGTRVATGSTRGEVRVWDAMTGAVLASCPAHGRIVRDVVFSSDARFVVSAGDDFVVSICDTATGASLHRLEGHTGAVLAIDRAVDNRLVVSAGNDSTVRVWDVATGHLAAALTGHRGTVPRVRFSPDGTRVLTGGADATVRIWDTAGTELGMIQLEAAIENLDWNADGRSFTTVTLGSGNVRTWSVDQIERAVALKGHRTPIGDLFAASKLVLTSAEDGVALWNAAHLAQLPAPALGEVQGARLSADGGEMIVTDASGHVSLWTSTGTLVTRLPIDNASAAQLVGQDIITAGQDGFIRRWDRAGAARGAIEIGFAAIALEVDASGRWLVCQGAYGDPKEQAAPVIDLATLTIATKLRGDAGPPWHIALHGDRVAMSDGNVVRIAQLGTWRELARLEGHKGTLFGISFLGDGRLVTSGDDRVVMVWSEAGKLLAALPVGYRAMGIAGSADSTLFAAAGRDGSVRVWDAASYRELFASRGHQGPASIVAFSPDSRSLFSAGDDGRVVAWDLARPARTVAELDQLVKCRVPFRFDGTNVVPRELDLADPSCR